VNHPTVGRGPNSAMVERAAPSITPKSVVRLQLRQSDFTTSSRIEEAVNKRFSDPARPPAVAENAGKWEGLTERDHERMDAMARAIVNRLLHGPTARLKELRDDRVHARMALIRDLFGLEVESAAPAEQPVTELEEARRLRQRLR